MFVKLLQSKAAGTAALAVASCLFAHSTLAKSIHVEVYGEDTLQCGAKTTPCETINYAISAHASRNDRIIVGPGEYEENISIGFNLSGPLDGLKLESRTGRWSTIIRGDSDGLPVISANQPRIQIGRRGKGFTIIGPFFTDESTAGIADLGDATSRLRIEGNWFADHPVGILLDANNEGRHRISHNLFTDSIIGIRCGHCERSIISNNEFEINVEFDNVDTDALQSIYLENDSDFTSIFLNRIKGGSASGIFVDSQTEFLKILNNVVSDNSGHGYLFGDIVGFQIKGNIAANSDLKGMYLDQDGFAKGPNITSNLSLLNGQEGFDVSDTSNLVFDKNTSIQNTHSGIDFNNAAANSIKGNTSYDNDLGGSGCGLNKSASNLEYQRHFFGDASGADALPDGDGHDSACGGWVGNNSFSTKPGPLSLNKTNKL